MALGPTPHYTGGMTYRVPVAHRDQIVTVKVEANDPASAKEIARWLVEHAAHLQAHGVEAKKH
jgi:capsule polysaccharide export protein KpsE/RkpR